MLDGDEPKSEEERLEEIKFEIKRLFDDLELEVIDPDLKERRDKQEELVITLLAQTEETINLPAEIRNKLNEYYQTLDDIAEETKDDVRHAAIIVKVAVSHSKIYYDSGKLDVALDLLDDPDDPDAGAEAQSRNMVSWSEEHLQLHKNIDQLISLMIKEFHSKKE